MTKDDHIKYIDEMTALADAAKEDAVNKFTRSASRITGMAASPTAFLEVIRAMRTKMKSDFLKSLKENQREAVYIGRKAAALK